VDRTTCLTERHLTLTHVASDEGSEARVTFRRLLREWWYGALTWLVVPVFFGVVTHPAVGLAIAGVGCTVFLVVSVYRLAVGHTPRCAVCGAASAVLAFEWV
jgi:hypothetical protein